MCRQYAVKTQVSTTHTLTLSPNIDDNTAPSM